MAIPGSPKGSKCDSEIIFHIRTKAHLWGNSWMLKLSLQMLWLSISASKDLSVGPFISITFMRAPFHLTIPGIITNLLHLNLHFSTVYSYFASSSAESSHLWISMQWNSFDALMFTVLYVRGKSEQVVNQDALYWERLNILDTPS